MHDEAVRVEAYAGGRGDEEPRAFWLDEERIEVARVERRWVEEEQEGRERRRFFEVAGGDGLPHLLYHDERLGVWFYRSPKVRPCRI